MKTRAILFLILLLSFITTVNAQSTISAVYGVNLGDSEYTVTSKVSGSWKTTSKGKQYYKTISPTLGNCTFDDASFWFEDGKLYRVNFSSYAETYIEDEQILAKAERFQRMYRTMYSDLAMKYGSPIVDDGDRAIWKSNGNRIELKYIFEDNTVDYYGYCHYRTTQISVSYIVGESTPSNF